MSEGFELLFIKPVRSEVILNILGYNELNDIANIPGKDAVSFLVSAEKYNCEQVRAFFIDNDTESIEVCSIKSAVPKGYYTNGNTVVIKTYSGYTKELDINYDNINKTFEVLLQCETTASLEAMQCVEQSLEAQAALIEYMEGME